jgi:hypothetical protein
MLISSLLLASLVSLSTAAVTGSGNHHAVKMQVFKRDDVPTPHDLELAEMHQANLTESKLCNYLERPTYELILICFV